MAEDRAGARAAEGGESCSRVSGPQRGGAQGSSLPFAAGFLFVSLFFF